MMLNKAHWTTLSSKMLKFAKTQVVARLKRKIALDVDVAEFFRLVRNQQGFVAGSIFIEMLLGEAAFKAGDIDIFVCTQKLQRDLLYDPLQKYLFEKTTGLASNPAISYPHAIISEYRKKVKAGDSAELYGNLMDTFDLYTYSMSSKFQVISFSNPNIQNHISRFDIAACKSCYDGETLALVNLMDVARRCLHCSDYFHLQAFDEWQAKQHATRRKRYEDRGFQFAKPANRRKRDEDDGFEKRQRVSKI